MNNLLIQESDIPTHQSDKILRSTKPATRRCTLHEAWSGKADCVHCTLRSSALFAGLEPSDFENIHPPIAQFKLAPETRLYRAGDSGQFMFTIRSGLVKQLRLLPDGNQRILRLSHHNDVLGLETLVLDAYQHDAVVLHTAEVCRFSTKTVRQLAEENINLRHELTRRWQMALQDADNWIVELSTGSARARIARLLLRLAVMQEQNVCELVSREDMGAIVGITTETASRIIADFKRQGLTREMHSNTCTLDIPRLKLIATE
jgi:CRP-like cAMP-binding protein